MKDRLDRADRRLSQLMVLWWAVALAMALLNVGSLLEAHDAEAVTDWWVGQGLTLLLGMPVWCMLAWPLWQLPTPRARAWGVGLLAGALLLGEAALLQYQHVAGVPLGADLLAYSWSEIVTTVVAAGSMGASAVPWTWGAGVIVGLAAVIAVLRRTARRDHAWPKAWPRGLAVGLWGVSALAVANVSSSSQVGIVSSLKASWIQQSKLSYFLGDVLAKALNTEPQGTVVGQVFADYPFARYEKTPDTLGPLLQLKDDAPPHLVFVIVEGLGRDFSGPGARLGSFTPFLDELAQRSLYWENFLAPQGRTFAVLHSVFGSLPFGAHGSRPVAHDSLLSVLKTRGYAMRYFTGTNLEFDQQGAYLAHEGVSEQFSERDFGKPERRLSEWGYSDEDVLEVAGAELQKPASSPTVTIVQTMTMHTPFKFPGLEAYRPHVEARLNALGLPAKVREEILSQRDIYASILYTDEMLRRFLDALARSPRGANTVVVITGDHRMPDIPMDTRLERFHVPLIVASPLVRAPLRVKAVSSHFDIAPSLLALLSNKYEWPTPRVVSWMGQGLDVSTEFRNVHALPLQQTKTELSDYVSGLNYLGQGRLYALSDGLHQAPVDRPEDLNRLSADFEAFKAGKAWLAKADRLTPLKTASQTTTYVESQRTLESQGPLTQLKGVVVAGTEARYGADGALQVRATFTQHGKDASVKFVPLLVLTDEQGREYGEAYGTAMQLKAGEAREVVLTLAPKSQPTGPQFAAVVVSHPDTGKAIGQGQYHVGVKAGK